MNMSHFPTFARHHGARLLDHLSLLHPLRNMQKICGSDIQLRKIGTRVLMPI